MPVSYSARTPPTPTRQPPRSEGGGRLTDATLIVTPRQQPCLENALLEWHPLDAPAGMTYSLLGKRLGTVTNWLRLRGGRG